MGIYDRPYFREESNYSAGFGRPAGARFGLSKPPSAVATLLLINVAVFILQALARGDIKAVLAVTVGRELELWRLVTFQFLHDGFGHIFWNMLWLYFLGTPLERVWGPKRFWWFYLTSGAAAGVAFTIIGRTLALPADSTLVGASGGVSAVILACFVMFPNVRMLVFFMFPVPLRIIALVYFGRSLLIILESVSNQAYPPAFWSEVAHMGGLVGGAFWIWVVPRLQGKAGQVRVKMNQGAWDKKLHRQAEEQKTINEVLRKVHDQGINSLTAKEKKILAHATRRQREQGG